MKGATGSASALYDLTLALSSYQKTWVLQNLEYERTDWSIIVKEFFDLQDVGKEGTGRASGTQRPYIYYPGKPQNRKAECFLSGS